MTFTSVCAVTPRQQCRQRQSRPAPPFQLFTGMGPGWRRGASSLRRQRTSQGLVSSFNNVQLCSNKYVAHSTLFNFAEQRFRKGVQFMGILSGIIAEIVLYILYRFKLPVKRATKSLPDHQNHHLITPEQPFSETLPDLGSEYP